MTKPKSQYLFGSQGCKWSEQDWTASDDRVRGGQSRSYFAAEQSKGRFYGNLDIKTLGGAGFASQRTTGDDRNWDLSTYAGILLDVAKADGKRYTFILKDELLPPNSENGREQATISYEYDLDTRPTKADDDGSLIEYVAWSSFKPTYRGKEKKDAKPLDPATVKRVSMMMRSFFGTQEGPFSISLNSITAVSAPPESLAGKSRDIDIEKAQVSPSGEPASNVTSSPWLFNAAAIITIAAIYMTYRRFVVAR